MTTFSDSTTPFTDSCSIAEYSPSVCSLDISHVKESYWGELIFFRTYERRRKAWKPIVKLYYVPNLMMTVSMFWCLLFTPGRLLTLSSLFIHW